ncbi:MAG: tRNA lysidine(34) synthetase TilS [Candidatus Omnitrophica bacterium]|nr:tRNA lysidine(34) synthetase TilS [Candidatus Omnitrophota bacterium]
MWPRGAKILVGVSGGPDSMALLTLLAELRECERLTVWAVYVNHGWRPAAARRERALVQRVGRRLGVPVLTVSLAPDKRPRQSWEGTARDRRYAALARLARRVGARHVAVGHTQEDQAETVLLALARGSGLTGAGGMPVGRALGSRRLRLIRPLLMCRHAALQAYLRGRRIPWVVDPTNTRPAFRRNRLRRTVLPPLARAFGPSVVERLAAFAEVAREDDRWLQRQTAHWCRRHVRAIRGRARVAAPLLRGQPVALQRRIVRWMIARAVGSLRRVAFRHVAACLELVAARRPGRLDWPRGVTVRVTARAVVVSAPARRR